MREGLKRLINDQPNMEVIGEADDGITACAKAYELLPDIVLMDISMPGLNGADATRKIKEECPDIKVLALTAQRATAYLDELLKAGASGYVLKQVAFHELIQAICIVANGGIYLDKESQQHIADSYLDRGVLKGEARGKPLTEREAEVLPLIANGHTNKEIARKLDVSVKTVETHKANSMRKLNLRSRAELVNYARDRGWL
jgi:DNA-binding NarL/FixJ family response regulator